MRFTVALLLLICSTALIPSGGARAQNANPPVWNMFSLQGWEDQQRTAITDRRGARFGYVTDRGLFQRFTPGMTDEFDLNMFSFGYSLQQDYLWFRNDNGFRSFAGRQTDLTMAVFSQFKTEAEVATGTRFGFKLTAEQDARLDRGLAVISLQREVAKNHLLSVQHTITGYQQDADLSLRYQYGHPQIGFARVEVTALDYLNNSKISSINSDLTGADTLRYYRSRPFYTSVAVSTPIIEGWQGELFSGWVSPAEAELSQAAVRNRRFKVTETANYQGLLIQYRKNTFTAGFTYQRELTRTDVDTLLPSVYFSRYNSTQIQRTYGAHLMLSSNDYLLESTVLSMLQRDRQDGSDFVASPTYQDSLDFRATRFLVRNRIMKRPFFKGMIAGLEHAADFRAPGTDATRMRFWSNSLHDVNQRLSIITGWQFNPRAWIMTGYALDLDADYHREPAGDFSDGAFIRLELRW